MKRPHNEDAYFHDDAMQLYVVADGMGGHAAGEVASWEAVQAVQMMVRQGADRVVPVGKLHDFDLPWDGVLPLNRLVRWVLLRP